MSTPARASVRKFLALDSQRKRLFLEAFCLLGSMRWGLSTRPFRSLTEGLVRHPEPFAPPSPNPADLRRAEDVGWSVRTAARFTPWNSSCLVEVLAAQRMLQRRAIPGAFYIGANRGPPRPEPANLEAHAWLKCGDRFITGQAGHADHTVVTAFSWQ